MKKYIVPSILVILMLVIAGVMYMRAITEVKGEELTYYGKVDKDNVVNKLISTDKNQKPIYNYKVEKEDANVKEGDYVRVIFTDQRGVILETKKVMKEDVPKPVLDKLK